MAPSNKSDMLRASSAFAMLDQALLAELAAGSSLSRRGGADDDFLFRAGDPAEGLYLIVPARARTDLGPAVQISFDDRTAAAARVGYRLLEGEITGDIEFLMSGLSAAMPARIASARALRPVQILHVPAAGVGKALQASDVFRRRLVRDASRRLTSLLMKKAAEPTVHPEIRLAEDLLTLLDDYGRIVANKGFFRLRLTQQQIADKLGMSLRLFSLRCSELSARGLIETSPFSLPDVHRLDRIASFGRQSVREVLPEAIEEVEGLVARDRLAQASQMATDALVVFPGNPCLVYQLALASARSGAGERAARFLAAPAFEWDGSMSAMKSRLREAWARSLDGRHLGAEGLDEDCEDDLRAYFEARLDTLAIDIAALHARIVKDAIGTSPDDRSRRAEAGRAALIYRQVHAMRPNHYCAVNAASMSRIARRDDAVEALAQEAARLAERDRSSYWGAASKGEALLLLGRHDEAADAFRDAVARPDSDIAKRTSTRRQLRLLSELADIDAGASLAALDPGMVLLFSGLLLTEADGTAAELEEAAQAIKAQIVGLLAGRRVPAAYSSAACGSDILFAEAALEAGIPLHLVLPFGIEEFADLSVRIGGDAWEARFLHCLDEAASVSELWRHGVGKSALNHHFLRANRHLAGEAVFAAHSLETKPHMLAVIDTRHAGTLAGTSHLAGMFADLGHGVSVIDAPYRRNPARPGSPGQDPFAPVVFAFACAQGDNAALAERLPALGFETRMMKDRRLAGQKVCADWREALALASETARRAEEDMPATRIICDYGPVRQRGGAVDRDAVLKLDAAFDLAGAVLGDIFATPAFAMTEIATGGDPASYAAVNVSAEAVADGNAITLQGVRQIYRIQRRASRPA